MFGRACRICWVNRDLGGFTKVVKVVRKLQRVGSNGLYAVKNSPAPSYQLAHWTGTTIEFQLRLEPIYLCDQLYPRFLNRPVQCAQFGGLPLEVARSFANRRVRMYLRTACNLSKGTLLLAECAPCFRIRRKTVKLYATGALPDKELRAIKERANVAGNEVADKDDGAHLCRTTGERRVA